MSSVSGSYVNASLWEKRELSVCWSDPAESSASDRDLVRLRVQNTWQKHSALQFTGWGPCSQRPDSDIKLVVRDQGPHAAGLGKSNQYTSLNFTFKNWSTDCAYPESNRVSCLESNAIHEFGHILGIAHEHNRSDRHNDCIETPQGTDGDVNFGAFDRYSIMNYCFGSSYRNRLSATDIATIQYMYGAPRGTIKASDFAYRVSYGRIENGQMEIKLRLTATDSVLNQLDSVEFKLLDDMLPTSMRVNKRYFDKMGHFETAYIKTSRKAFTSKGTTVNLRNGESLYLKGASVDWSSLAPKIEPTDFSYNVTYGEIENDQMNMKIQLQAKEEILSQIDKVEFFLWDSMNPSKWTVTRDQFEKSGIFETPYSKTFARKWQTKGTLVYLKSGEVIDVDGARIDWTTHHRKLTPSDFRYTLVYGEIRDRQMPLRVRILADRDVLDQVSSVEFSLWDNMNPPREVSNAADYERSGFFETSLTYTYARYWKTKGTVVNLKDGSSLRLPGAQIDWRWYVGPIRASDFSYKVYYSGIANGQMNFAVRLQADETVLNQIEEVTFDLWPNMNPPSQTVTQIDFQRKGTFETATSGTYAKRWQTKGTRVVLKGGRTIVLPGALIDW